MQNAHDDKSYSHQQQSTAGGEEDILARARRQLGNSASPPRALSQEPVAQHAPAAPAAPSHGWVVFQLQPCARLADCDGAQITRIIST